MAGHTITVAPSGDRVAAEAGLSILDSCIAAGLPMAYNCRSGECGECVATLVAGDVAEMPGADPAVFTDRDRDQGRVLTCMCHPRGDLTIEVALRDGKAAPRIERVNAMVEAIIDHGPHVVEVRLATPWPLDYVAGQYFAWVLPGIAPDRSFSAANRPGNDVLAFHVRLYPGGKVGEYVRRELGVGQVVELVGPFGHFHLSPNDHRPAICVAGGTGMAPIRALIDDAMARGDRRPIRYYYGTRRQEDLYCLDDMAAWAASHPDFRFVPVLSDEPAKSGWRGARGLVTEVLEAEMGDGFGAEAYLCGPPPMIDAAIEVLLAGGLAEDDIHYDKFTPAK